MGNEIVKVCKVCGRGTKKMKRDTCKGCGAHSRDCWIILSKKTRQRVMSARRRSIIAATTTLTLRRNASGGIGVEFNNDLLVTKVDPWAKQFGVEEGQQVVKCCGIRVKTKEELIKVYKQHQRAGDPDVFILTVIRSNAQATKTLMSRRGADGKLGVNFDSTLKVVGLSDWAKQFGIRVGQRVVACEGIPVKNKAEMVRVHNDHVTSDSEHADPDVFILSVIDPTIPLTASVVGESLIPTAQVVSVSTMDAPRRAPPPVVPGQDQQGNSSFRNVSSFQSMQSQGSSVVDMFGSALDIVVEENDD